MSSQHVDIVDIEYLESRDDDSMELGNEICGVCGS